MITESYLGLPHLAIGLLESQMKSNGNVLPSIDKQKYLDESTLIPNLSFCFKVWNGLYIVSLSLQAEDNDDVPY